MSMEDLFVQGKDLSGWQYSPGLVRIQMSRQNRPQEPNERDFHFHDDDELEGAAIDVGMDDEESIPLPHGFQATPGRVFRGTTPTRVARAPVPADNVAAALTAKRGRNELDEVEADRQPPGHDLDLSYSHSPDDGLAKKSRAVTEDAGQHQHSFGHEQQTFQATYPMPDMPLSYYMPPYGHAASRVDSFASIPQAEHHIWGNPYDNAHFAAAGHHHGNPLYHPGAPLYQAAVASHSSPMSEGSSDASPPPKKASSNNRRSRTAPSRPAAGSAPRNVASAHSSSPSSASEGDVRLEPTEEEVAEAVNDRLKDALKTWYTRLQELHEYKEEHGDCNVPQKYGPLGIWVNKQRMEKKALDDGKKSSMTSGRLDALTRLGFTWAKRKGDHIWNERFSELQVYRQENGDSNVPTKYPQNPALGRWVSTQRSQYKLYMEGSKSSLNKEKIKKLNKEGFQWTMNP